MADTYEISGRTVTMPVEVRDAAAGTAIFEIDAAAARAIIPGDAFDVVEVSPGRAHLVLAVIDYKDNDLGDYLEVGITFFVLPRGVPGATPGTYIHRLPVDQAFTCAAGKQIWGFPKTVEQIAFDYSDDNVTCTLTMDEELVLRLRIPRGGTDASPSLAMTTYTYLDGQPHATGFSQEGSGSQMVLGADGIELELGTHPVAKEIESLGATPVMSTWTERMIGRFEAPVAL